jgi:predicted murein hydrolase (TIGR00659 family)
MTLNEFYAHPLFGSTLTLALFLAAVAFHRRFGGPHPILLATGGVVAVLVLFRIPYESYNVGGGVISFFLGPATVALGLPLYRHANSIGRQWMPIAAGIVAGTVTSIATGGLVVHYLGGDHKVMLSMLPRGCTTPIAMEVSRQLGGDERLTASFTGLSGLFGGLFGPALLKAFRVRRGAPTGTALGTSAHGFGTARALRLSDKEGGVAALAMASSGILTSILAIGLRVWLRG